MIFSKAREKDFARIQILKNDKQKLTADLNSCLPWQHLNFAWAHLRLQVEEEEPTFLHWRWEEEAQIPAPVASEQNQKIREGAVVQSLDPVALEKRFLRWEVQILSLAAWVAAVQILVQVVGIDLVDCIRDSCSF